MASRSPSLPAAARLPGRLAPADVRGTHSRSSTWRLAHPSVQARRHVGGRLWSGGRWVRVHDDGDWSTIIVFEGLLTVTNALITWDIPPGTPAGEYRVVYTASGRGLDGRLFPVRGESRAFDVR
nr:neutral/alkaline non-lysosomal ceramidase C-terminal domain-containing protein [Dietzia lutea]